MPLLVASVGFMLGTGLGLGISSPLHAPVLAAAGLTLALLGGAFAWPHPGARLLTIAFAAAALGGVRAHLGVTGLAAEAVPPGSRAVQGTVAESPRELGRLRAFVLDVDRVFDGSAWSVRYARVEVQTFGWSPAEGERVEVLGVIRPLVDSPGLPRASMLRKRRVTQELVANRVRPLRGERRADPAGALVLLRGWLENQLADRLPQPNAALLAGLLLGSRQDLPTDLRAQLARTGTSHIVAVSGFNVVIVGGFVIGAASCLTSARIATIPAIVATIAYTLLVGAPASAVRAMIMADVALVATMVRRPADALGALALSGALMSAFDPLVLQDLGFQLSMLATAGLILLLPNAAPAGGPVRWLLTGVGPSWAAQIFTLPLILHTFHTLSLVALLTNVLIAPFIPVAMGAGALVLLLHPFEPIVWLPILGAYSATEWILTVVRATAQLPGAWIATGAFPTWLMVGCYAALGLCVLSRSADLELFGMPRPRASPVLGTAAVLLAVALGAAALVAFRPPGELRAEAFQHGDVMFVRAANGRTALIGADMPPLVLTATVADQLAPWEQGLDLAVLLDDSSAQIRALGALSERYAVRLLLTPPGVDGSRFAGRPQSVVSAAPGMTVDLGDGLLARVTDVSPAESHSPRHVGLELRYGDTALSFPWRSADSPASEDTASTRMWVLRDWHHAPSVSDPATVVAWGAAARDARVTSERPVAILPARDGTVSIRTDGSALRLYWPRCPASIEGCGATVGGAW